MNRFDNVYAFSREPSERVERTRCPTALARRPLWDLPAACHCPLIGVCCSAEQLRDMLDALFGGQSSLCDFDLHAGVVRECASRNKVSEVVQNELDALYAKSVQSVAGVNDASALALRWLAASRTPEVAGTFWAALSHPCCDSALTERLLRDMHLIQHHAVHDIHLHVEAIESAAAENRRLHDALAEQSRQCEQLRRAVAEQMVRKRSVWKRLSLGISHGQALGRGSSS